MDFNCEKLLFFALVGILANNSNDGNAPEQLRFQHT